MTDAERLAEAKRLVLLAMDQFSRVADLTLNKKLARQAEDLFSDCEEVVEGVDRIAKDL